MYNLVKNKTIWAIIGGMISMSSFAQATDGATASSFSVDNNTLLLIIAAILLGIILVLVSVVYSAIDLYKSKQNTNGVTGKTLGIIFGILFTTIGVSDTFAQEVASATTDAVTSSSLASGGISLLLILFILIEIVVILYLVKQIRFLTGIEALEQSKIKTGTVLSTWDKINSFKPLDQEKDLDVGHSYDGIRELDNIAPPWFTIGFAFSILFAIVYMYRYHISESAPLQIQEYELSIAEAKANQAALEKLQPAKKVDENNLKLLGVADIAKGQELFVKNCGTCHANDGGGGAGPNLTDSYWIHGGSLKNIFVSIRDGFGDKGMPSWSAALKPEQIDQLTSFIKSLNGTKPAAPKAQQGDLYTEEVATSASVEADSTKAN